MSFEKGIARRSATLYDVSGSVIGAVSGSDGTSRIATNSELTGSIPSGSNKIGKIDVDYIGNIATETTLESLKSSFDDFLISGSAGQAVQIVDGNGSGIKAIIDSSGRLTVATPPPEPPPGTTAVNVVVQGNVGGNDDIYTNYTIPSGQTLTITRFSGGAEGDKASKVELYYDSTGSGVGTLIRVAYLNNSNFDYALNVEYVGDGTARIRLRRARLDAGSREIAGFWDGFLE